MNTNDLLTEDFSKISATLKTLQDNGVNADHFKKIRSNEEFAKNVSNFIVDDCILKGIFNRSVRKIMGKNIWGPEEWCHYYDKEFSIEELKTAQSVPWSTDFLTSSCPYNKEQKVYETHFLFWLPPSFKFTQEFYDYLNVHLDISKIEARDEFVKFMNKTYESGWYLILLDSCDPALEGDFTSLKPGYLATDILLELTKQVLYKKLYGRPNISGFSSNETLNGIRFYLSENFPPSTVNIHHGLDWTRNQLSVRKVD